MAPRCPTLAMLTVVATVVACSTTPPRAPSTDELTYLQGVTSEYSVRLDELRSHRGQPSRLPEAVVGGDDTFTIAASMFRKEPYLGLELVIQNQTDQPLFLERQNVQLFDNSGNRLATVNDFAGASELGLRSKVRARRDYASHSPTAATSSASTPRNSSDASQLRKNVSSTLRVDPQMNQQKVDFLWMGDLTEEESAAPPPALVIDAKENRPYWAYWKMSPDLEFPLTAIITLDNKRVLMKFES